MASRLYFEDIFFDFRVLGVMLANRNRLEGGELFSFFGSDEYGTPANFFRIPGSREK